MLRRKIILRFKTVRALWSFCRYIRANDIHINFEDRLLTCECTELELQIAIEFYEGEEIALASKKPS